MPEYYPSMPQTSVLIAGAGPIGLACAISAKRHGHTPLVIDAGLLANSVVHYPVGMSFFTTPDKLEIGDHPLVCAGQKPTREEALKYYRGVARAEGLVVRPFARLSTARRANGRLLCQLETRLGSDTVECETLVLATGYYDNPNRLGVPGEDLPHVHHYFDEPHRGVGQQVVVVGGGNSAVEAALELYRAGARVTIVARGPTLKPTVKYWLQPDIQNRIEAGEIAARLGAQVTAIEPDAVRIRNAAGTVERLPADRVYTLIGFHPDFELFRRIGITLHPKTARPTLTAATLETNVRGVHMAGSITAGYATSEVFIENGRFDGEKIFGGLAAPSSGV
jgi:thioredoxin reductase (NADPH)